MTLYYYVSIFRSRFTAIAVDWQYYGADRQYYDIIFVGMGKSCDQKL